MNGILTLTRNNLALTQRAVHSFLRQDVNPEPVIRIIDNGSTDGTRNWAWLYQWLLIANEGNLGVSRGWNEGLNWFFKNGFDRVLVIGNDTWIPEYFYRELMSYNLPFVTGVAVGSMEQVQPKPSKCPLDPHPDFSAFMITRQCWNELAPFNEAMKHYASDCDFHIRAHRKGIRLWKASVEFYHERSSTIRNATPEEAAELTGQANKDRAVLQKLYGCLPGTREYELIFEQDPPSLESSLVSSGSISGMGMVDDRTQSNSAAGASPSSLSAQASSGQDQK